MRKSTYFNHKGLNVQLIKQINIAIFFLTLVFVGTSVLTHTVTTKKIIQMSNTEFINTLAILELKG